MRKAALMFALVFGLSFGGCAWLREQYKAPPGGGPSNVEKVQSAVRGLPYGGIIDLGLSLVGAIVGGGAVHATHKRKQKKTKAKHDAVVADLLAKTTPPGSPLA